MKLDNVIMGLDLELLKEQAQSLETVIEWINEEIDFGAAEEEYIDRLELDKENLEGLLEFIDNIVCALEEEE